MTVKRQHERKTIQMLVYLVMMRSVYVPPAVLLLQLQTLPNLVQAILPLLMKNLPKRRCPAVVKTLMALLWISRTNPWRRRNEGKDQWTGLALLRCQIGCITCLLSRLRPLDSSVRPIHMQVQARRLYLVLDDGDDEWFKWMGNKRCKPFRSYHGA